VPRVCTVCSHPNRAEIDQVLVAGELPFRTIADRFGLSQTALKRHRAEHVPVKIATAKAAQEVTEAGSLLDQIVQLKKLAMHFLVKASEAGDYRTALAGVREARSCLETLMEVEGELDRRPVVNIVTTPAWVELRSTLLQSLTPYPAARIAVATALTSIEARHVA
jgi:hypothetical protein